MSGARVGKGRAARWAGADPRVGALIVVGSVAAGTATVFSDLDLVVVAREGQRDGLWAEREQIAETLLGQRLGWCQDLRWQGPFRFQARPVDFGAMVDLTFDEGRPSPSRALLDGFEVLVDRDGIEDGVRAELAGWEPPGPDVVAIDDSVWPWFVYLDGLLRRGRLWTVRAELQEILHRRVAPVLGAARDLHEADLSEHDLGALQVAAPTSGRPDELRRALHATVELYQRAVDRWASQTGRQRPRHPLMPMVSDRLHR